MRRGAAESIHVRTLQLKEQPSFLRALRGAVAAARAGSVGTPRRRSREPGVPTREECASLLSACGSGKSAQRNRLLIRLPYATGLRTSEMIALRCVDIDFARAVIFVRKAKGNVDRYVCVDGETLRLLQEHTAGKRLEDPVFDITTDVGIWKIVRKVASAAGILQKFLAEGKRFSTHCLRHAFATHCYENGMSLLTLKKLLGHPFLVTTAIYVHTSTQICAREYARTHPFRRRDLPGGSPDCILSLDIPSLDGLLTAPDSNEQRGASAMTNIPALSAHLETIEYAGLLDEILLHTGSDDQALELAVAEVLASPLFAERARKAHGGADGDAQEPRQEGEVGAQILMEFREELGDEVGEAEVVVGRLPAVPSRDDFARLMTAFTKGKNVFRDNLVIRLLYATGMRRAELAALRFCDISFETGTALVRAGKGDKDRYVCIDGDTLDALKQHRKGKELQEPVIGVGPRGIARIVEQAGKITGIAQRFEAMDRKFSTHCLRHAFATHCYENGMRTITLKKLLGHKFIATTLIYVHTATDACAIEYGRTNPFAPRPSAPLDSRL